MSKITGSRRGSEIGSLPMRLLMVQKLGNKNPETEADPHRGQQGTDSRLDI